MKKTTSIWIKILMFVDPKRGKRRIQDHITAQEEFITQLKLANGRLAAQLETRDGQIARVALERDDARSHARQLAFQLDTAIRANRANELSHTLAPMERAIDSEDDVATQPLPKLSDKDLEQLLAGAPTMPLAQVEGSAHPVQAVHPIVPENPCETTVENTYVITTVVPATLRYRGIEYHGPEFTDPTHVLGRLR